jgi:hypothetical protein
LLAGCGGGGGGGVSPVPPGPDADRFIYFEGNIVQSSSNGSPDHDRAPLRASDFTSGRFSIVATDRYLNNELASAVISDNKFSIKFTPVNNDSYIMLTVKENTTNRFLHRNLIGRIPRYSEMPAGLKSLSVKNIEINEFSTALALLSAEKNITPPLFIDLSNYQGEAAIVKNYDEIKNYSQNQIVNNSGGILNVLELARAVKTLIYALTADALGAAVKNEILPPPRNFIEASDSLKYFVYALNNSSAASEIKAKGLAEAVNINKTEINSTTAVDNIKSVIDAIKPLEKVGDPVFSPAGGVYNATLEVTITTATPQAKIFYTADGRKPNSSSALYQGPVAVLNTQKLSAVAIKSDMVDSNIVTADYVINIAPPEPRAAAPLFDPPPGFYEAGYEVKISSATPSALIYYTRDGSDPLPGVSALYGDTSPILINSAFDLKAVAVKTGMLNSFVTSGAYGVKSIDTKVAAPVLSVPPGVYNSTREIIITTATGGASIYYTLDGSEPNLNSILYSRPVVAASSVTIKTFAVKQGYEPSPVVAGSYEIIHSSTAAAAPEFNYQSGIYDATLEVLITSATPGADIYYTLDHSVPSASSFKYNGTIEIAMTKTIKAVAIKQGYANSEISTADYTLNIHNQENIAKVTGLFYYSINKIVRWTPVIIEGRDIEYAVKIDGSPMPQYVTRPEFSVAMFFTGWRTIQVQAKIAGSLHPLDFGPLSNIYRFNIKAVSTVPQIGPVAIYSGYFNWQPVSDSDTVYSYRVMFDDDISNIYITKAACYGVPPGLSRGTHKLRAQAVIIDESGIQIEVIDEGPWSVEFSFNNDDGNRPYELIPYPENFGYEPIADELKWSLESPVTNYVYYILASYDRPSGSVYSKILDVAATDSVALEYIKSKLPSDSFNCVLEVLTFDGFNTSLKSPPIKLPAGELPVIAKVSGIKYDPVTKIITWGSVYANEQPCVYRIKVDGNLSNAILIKNEYNAAGLKSGTHEVFVQAIIQNYNPELKGPFSEPYELYVDTNIPQVMGLAYLHSRKIIRWLPVIVSEAVCYYRVKVDGKELPNLYLRPEYSTDILTPATHEVAVRAVIANTNPEIAGPYSETYYFNTQFGEYSDELGKVVQIQFDTYNSIIRWQPVLVDKLPIACYKVELDGEIMTHEDKMPYTKSACYGLSENITPGNHIIRVKAVLAETTPPLEGVFSEPVSFYLQRNDALYKKIPPPAKVQFDENNQTLYWDKSVTSAGMPTYNVIGYFNTGAQVSEQSFPIQETRLNIGVLKFDPRFLSMPSGKYSIEIQSGLIENSKAKGLKTPALILDLTDDRRWENIK